MRTHYNQKPRQLSLAPRASLLVRASKHDRISCETGTILLHQTLGWVGSSPMQTRHDLYPGTACQIEGGGWLQIQAGDNGAKLRLEAHTSWLGVALHALANQMRHLAHVVHADLHKFS